MKKKKLPVVLQYLRLYILKVVICCYLERVNCKVLKFHVNNFCYFGISASLFYAPHPKDSKLNKGVGRLT